MKARHRTEPTTAERARSILAAASSLKVTTEGGAGRLIDAHTVHSSGRLTLDELPGRRRRTAPADVPPGDLAAILEFTDIAPTPVRHRVRARLTLRGSLAAHGPSGAWRFRPVHGTLDEDDTATRFSRDDLALAHPDPLAPYEADLLAHLDTRTDTTTRLAALVPARHLLGVVRIRPVRLDRYGLVLRLEHARGGHDARLPFSASVSDCDQAKREIRTLLAQAAAPCPRLRRLRASS
ncbi:DUF2470 domain-containing protein [Streptomyces caniferus]|uniref:DUF2470 domain-containing protein n=1 Tax=Streptomyces caniferus TaxID=285557 RepID=A0ABZ1VWP4_9ACTN|nr:DUF2470 domain-containing protein [Streptomyces caniferus]